MKTPFYGMCDRENSKYFETYASLLSAKLVETEQFEIISEKK